MSSDIAIKADSLSKCYQIYDKPRDRLLQMLAGRKKQYYKEFWALNDVSFEVKKGETVGIIGRNGSGKSTLLQMICGTVSPTRGQVKTRGRVAALLELGAGFNTEFTGRENVLLNATILGCPKEEMAAKMNKVVEFSELGEFIDQPVKTYSSGMYARLAFSIAINVDPDILIIDEALSVGDARFVAKCMRRIADIKDKGATILFVSHDVGSVRTLCEHAIWLDKGHLVEQGSVFPVTARFMEYMFKDEGSIESPLPEPILLEQDTSSPEHFTSDGQVEVCNGGRPLVEPPLPGIIDSTLDARPVVHWGSHKGIIHSAAVRDLQGVKLDLLPWGKEVEVVIDLKVPRSIPREHLSAAFSIKDLKGTDLIVSTTHDFENKLLPDEENFSVTFRFSNPLVTGKYLLVAAIENRQYRDIHYYEYVEGAHYFASLSNERFFGIFQPQITQQIVAK